MNAWKKMLGSKKFQAMVAGVIVSFLVVLVPQLEPMEEHLDKIIATVVSYIVGQGLADFGKEAI